MNTEAPMAGVGKYVLWVVGPSVPWPRYSLAMACPAAPGHAVGLGQLHSWNAFLGSPGGRQLFPTPTVASSNPVVPEETRTAQP